MLISDQDILHARLSARVRDKLFAHRALPENTRVAVRLNLRGGMVEKFSERYFLQTIHDRTPSGTSLGYDGAVTMRNALFYVNTNGRRDILAGRRSKFPMAAVIGDLTHIPALTEGVEIAFNPMRHHLFVELATGYAIRAADEVTVFNTRCYARGQIEYWDEDEAPSPLDGQPSQVMFRRESG